MKNNQNIYIFLLMLVLVPLAGEPKIHPFSGELSSFRVSFGSPIFLLFLLWIRNTSFILSGFCVGLSVTLFRIGLDLLTNDHSFSSSLLLRGPTFFYYLTYAACFHLPKVNTLYSKALQIAGWSILAEFAASIVELSLTNICSSTEMVITLDVLMKIIIIAIIRCFFILSFFFLVQLHQAETKTIQERKQNERMILLISSLYEEVIQLNKSQKNAENVTRNCYQIYENLQNTTDDIDKQALSKELLGIAGQVHEIKKDNQRIYAGLSQLTNNRKINDYMPATELGDMIVKSNRKYACSLGKEIIFSITVDSALHRLHVYTVLSLVNNLVANAVEAIEHIGNIIIKFSKIKDTIEIEVCDNGIGVPEARAKLLFKPGYTTKFDAEGNPSSGVGLPYVKHLAGELDGTIYLDNSMSNKTIFRLTLPLKNLEG